jgi:drug/metabolite transporter (DMT)-like permease
VVEMIGAMEKGIEAAKISTPPAGVYQDVDLSVLPKYISFRAALLKEKLTLQYVIGILVIFFGVYFIVSRMEVGSLYSQLREK